MDQIRRLFFRKPEGALASLQAVSARLKKLVDSGFLATLAVEAGNGSGPLAYGLGPLGRTQLGEARSIPPAPVGPIWHYLEVAEFRIRFQEMLEAYGGRLGEWLGEQRLRSLLAGHKNRPVPDGLAHWRFPDREGTLLLEWDRGTESLAVLTRKIRSYQDFWQSRLYAQVLPGLGLRPRLALIVKSSERANRIVHWLLGERDLHLGTILIGTAETVLEDPLGSPWWRSDTREFGGLAE